MYPEGIRCKLRHQTLSEHRQVFFMMAREMGYSYSYLSKFLDYNHATVIHSYNKVMDMLKIQDKVMTDIYQGIKCKLYDNEPIQDTGGESDLPKSDLSAL
jgi:chromosomal replication initiation ATPase DnaA